MLVQNVRSKLASILRRKKNNSALDRKVMNMSENATARNTGTTFSELHHLGPVYHSHWRGIPELSQSVHTAFAITGFIMFVLSLAGNVSVLFLFRRLVYNYALCCCFSLS